jgi:hypothetical protein
MAATFKNPDASALSPPAVPGFDRVLYVLVTGDSSSYATASGGYVITPSTIGLSTITDVEVSGVNVQGDRLVTAVNTAGTWSFRLFSALGTEVADGSDQSAKTWRAVVRGRA